MRKWLGMTHPLMDPGWVSDHEDPLLLLLLLLPAEHDHLFSSLLPAKSFPNYSTLYRLQSSKPCALSVAFADLDAVEQVVAG